MKGTNPEQGNPVNSQVDPQQQGTPAAPMAAASSAQPDKPGETSGSQGDGDQVSKT